MSFELQQKQSLALIKPNKTKKTTILKLLTNITKPTTNELIINNRLSALIELGAGFHPDLTGRENIFLNGIILGLPRKEIERRFEEIVDFSELDRFIDTPVKRYSSGMTVRLGFAVASCIEPDILLVDEVLAVGDASFQQKCLHRIRFLLESGTSIIFVSHNLYLVRATCESGLYLHKGQVKLYGDIEDALHMYENDIHQERAARLTRSHYATGSNSEDDEVEITRVEVWGPDGPVDILYSNQHAVIRIHYNAYRPFGKVQVSVFVFRSDGITACMMRTKLDDFDVFVEEGSGIVSVQLDPLQLVGGAYYAEASFINEADSAVITPRAEQSNWFMVQGAALSYSESSVFEPNTRWQHTRLSSQVVQLNNGVLSK